MLVALLGASDAVGQGRRGAVISGRVTSVEGGPVAGARVSLVPQDGGAAAGASATTGEDGRYEVHVGGGGLPGEFVVRVEADGFEPA